MASSSWVNTQLCDHAFAFKNVDGHGFNTAPVKFLTVAAKSLTSILTLNIWTVSRLCFRTVGGVACEQDTYM